MAILAVKGWITYPVEFEAPMSYDTGVDHGDIITTYQFSCQAEIVYEAERESKGESWWVDYEVGALFDLQVLNPEGDEVDIPEEGPLLDAIVNIVDEYLLVTMFDDIVYKCNEDAHEVAAQ